MNSKLFGTLAAGAVAGMLFSGSAFAEKGKKKAAKKEAKPAAAEGWCKSNDCGGKVKDADGTAAKNECAGKMACKGIKKEDCEKDAAGTWSTEAQPKK